MSDSPLSPPAPRTTPEHVCGLQGFGRGIDGINDRCPACESPAASLSGTPAPTPNEDEMHGRAADQFPRGARSWVEVGPNMGGGITVTTYQDDERGLRGQPTYLVTNVGMPIAVARALAARIIAHCDSLSPAPSCYGSRDMGTDIPKGDDDGRQTAGSGNKQRHESPACAEGVGTGSSMPEVSAKVGARHTEPRTTVSSSTMPLVPTRGSDERPVASPAPTDRVQEIEARLTETATGATQFMQGDSLVGNPRTHCSHCDRPAICDLILRGTAPCGVNAGMSKAASDLYNDTEQERMRRGEKVKSLEAENAVLLARVRSLEADAARWQAVAPTLHACSISANGGYYMTTDEFVDGPAPSANEYADRLRAARPLEAPAND